MISSHLGGENLLALHGMLSAVRDLLARWGATFAVDVTPVQRVSTDENLADAPSRLPLYRECRLRSDLFCALDAEHGFAVDAMSSAASQQFRSTGEPVPCLARCRDGVAVGAPVHSVDLSTFKARGCSCTPCVSTRCHVRRGDTPAVRASGLVPHPGATGRFSSKQCLPSCGATCGFHSQNATQPQFVPTDVGWGLGSSVEPKAPICLLG